MPSHIRRFRHTHLTVTSEKQFPLQTKGSYRIKRCKTWEKLQNLGKVFWLCRNEILCKYCSQNQFLRFWKFLWNTSKLGCVNKLSRWFLQCLVLFSTNWHIYIVQCGFKYTRNCGSREIADFGSGKNSISVATKFDKILRLRVLMR